MLCSHHQFFSFSILSKRRYIDSHHSSSSPFLWRLIGSKGRLHATYLRVFSSNWPCPQTVKLTMFPIKTFSHSLRLAFIPLDHQISIKWRDPVATLLGLTAIRSVFASHHLQLQSERQGLLGFVSDGPARVQLQHQFFQFQLRERLP